MRFKLIKKLIFLNRGAKQTIKMNSSPEQDFAVTSSTENPGLFWMENNIFDSL